MKKPTKPQPPEKYTTSTYYVGKNDSGFFISCYKEDAIGACNELSKNLYSKKILETIVHHFKDEYNYNLETTWVYFAEHHFQTIVITVTNINGAYEEKYKEYKENLKEYEKYMKRYSEYQSTTGEELRKKAKIEKWQREILERQKLINDISS